MAKAKIIPLVIRGEIKGWQVMVNGERVSTHFTKDQAKFFVAYGL